MAAARKLPFSLRCLRFAFRTFGRVFPSVFGRIAHYYWFRPSLLRGKRPLLAQEIPAARHLTIPFVGGQLAALSLGEHGPTVCFVHGWGGDATQFTAFFRPYLERGFRGLALDLPAHGQSPRARTDLAEMANALESVVAAAGPVEALVTHSLGATCAAMALNQGLTVRCVVCLCPPADFEEMVSKVAETFSYPPGVVHVLKRLLERDFGKDVWTRFSTHENAKKLSLPCMILHDRADKHVPWEEGKLVADSWPGSRFVLTEGLGHFQLLSSPEVIRQTLEFISAQLAHPSATDSPALTLPPP